MERHANDPFALIGINTDSDKKEYREKAAEHEVTWRSAWCGSPASEIPRRFRVRAYPKMFLLDAEGRVRFVDLHDEKLDEAVAKLVAEAKRDDEK